MDENLNQNRTLSSGGVAGPPPTQIKVKSIQKCRRNENANEKAAQMKMKTK